MRTKAELAANFFNSGFNCAQSVLAVYCEKYGLPLASALKMASGFGGGIRNGEACGAVTGAVMVIGLRCGQSLADDKIAKSKCNAETLEFTDRFRRQNSTIICRELLDCDVSTPAGREKFDQMGLHQNICVKLVICAVDILEDMGY